MWVGGIPHAYTVCIFVIFSKVLSEHNKFEICEWGNSPCWHCSVVVKRSSNTTSLNYVSGGFPMLALYVQYILW
jgi:hypothetical protein